MLKAIAKGQLGAFRSALKNCLSGPGARSFVRTLTTPGGPIKNAKITWWEDPGIWVYFSPHSYDRRRWLCWYGLDLSPHGPLQPAIEINLSVDPSYRQVSGRALTDSDTDTFFLGHRGGLGGGRGGQMKVEDFTAYISEFGRDTILLDDHEEDAFVIGELEEQTFRYRLHAYVAECVRLRVLARAINSGAEQAPEGFGDRFRPEHDQDGFRLRTKAEVEAMKRLHGRVVNALFTELGRHATNGSHHRMRPDLYVMDRDGRMKVLFEVKARSDTQSWFTALGQLLVYGAGQSPPPVRVLVCPGPLKNPMFSRVLRDLHVELVTFEEVGRDVEFSGLKPWMC